MYNRRMNIYEYTLPSFGEPIADIDLPSSGGLLAVSAWAQTLVLDDRHVAGPDVCRFPLIRAIDHHRFLLADCRTSPQRENAWILNRQGTVEATFRLGDALANVVVIGQQIVATYFDEATTRNEDLCGVAVFSTTGHLLELHPFLDCVCAAPWKRQRVIYLMYPECTVCLLDPTTRKWSNWGAPEVLAGARAVTCAGDMAFFHDPLSDQHGIYRWPFAAATATRVADYDGRLRGISRGRFLRITPTGYTIVSVIDHL